MALIAKPKPKKKLNKPREATVPRQVERWGQFKKMMETQFQDYKAAINEV
jgi:hypothetical protein